MIRRAIILVSLAGAGWFVYARFIRRRPPAVDDAAGRWPDDQRGNVVDRVGGTASGAATAAVRVAQAPVEMVRSLVGGQQGETPEGERRDVTEGSAAIGSPPAGSDADRESVTSAAPSSDQSAQRLQDRGQALPSAEPGRTIKGNVRPDGEKIYHLPSDPAYARTNAEQWFASVDEAEAAGFRRAGRPREE
jgi:hypothetical protein